MPGPDFCRPVRSDYSALGPDFRTAEVTRQMGWSPIGARVRSAIQRSNASPAGVPRAYLKSPGCAVFDANNPTFHFLPLDLRRRQAVGAYRVIDMPEGCRALCPDCPEELCDGERPSVSSDSEGLLLELAKLCGGCGSGLVPVMPHWPRRIQ